MKPRPHLIPLLLLLCSGCATAGSGTEEPPGVPVYLSSQETPCEYEVLAPLSVEVYLRPGATSRDRDRLRDRGLGVAGREAGADAVIVGDSPERLPFQTGEVRMVTGTQVPPAGDTRIEFEGTAVKWIPETCKVGGR